MPKMKTNSGAKKRLRLHRIRKDQEKACFQKSHPDQENHQAETEPDLLGSHFEGRRGQREAAARKVIEEPPRAFSQTKSDLAPKSSGEPCR